MKVAGIKADKECWGVEWSGHMEAEGERERGHSVLTAAKRLNRVYLLACVKAQKGPTRANRSSS